MRTSLSPFLSTVFLVHLHLVVPDVPRPNQLRPFTGREMEAGVQRRVQIWFVPLPLPPCPPPICLTRAPNPFPPLRPLPTFDGLSLPPQSRGRQSPVIVDTSCVSNDRKSVYSHA